MPLGVEPQCAACKIYKSVMWRKGVNGETLCNSCHLKRVNSFLRSQRGTLKDSRRVSSSRLRPGRGKGSNGRHVERASKSAANRSRRTLFKQKPQKSPNVEATVVASDSIFYKGILYQVGDVVSLQDLDGALYFAQLRGFLQDQYARRSTVISWLIPTLPNLTHFDPINFIPGPDEDVPRSMDCVEFVCRAPSELFKQFDRHPPFVVPRKPSLDELTEAADKILDCTKS